jgi:hypothetical protein
MPLDELSPVNGKADAPPPVDPTKMVYGGLRQRLSAAAAQIDEDFEFYRRAFVNGKRRSHVKLGTWAPLAKALPLQRGLARQLPTARVVLWFEKGAPVK